MSKNESSPDVTSIIVQEGMAPELLRLTANWDEQTRTENAQSGKVLFETEHFHNLKRGLAMDDCFFFLERKITRDEILVTLYVKYKCKEGLKTSMFIPISLDGELFDFSIIFNERQIQILQELSDRMQPKTT